MNQFSDVASHVTCHVTDYLLQLVVGLREYDGKCTGIFTKDFIYELCKQREKRSGLNPQKI